MKSKKKEIKEIFKLKIPSYLTKWFFIVRCRNCPFQQYQFSYLNLLTNPSCSFEHNKNKKKEEKIFK